MAKSKDNNKSSSADKRSQETDSVDEVVDRILGQNPIVGLQTDDILKAGKILGEQVVKQPQLFLTLPRLFAPPRAQTATGKPELKPSKGDRRFSEGSWQSNPALRVIMQNYLSASHELREWMDETGLEDEERERASFVLEQSIDAMSPSNTFLNPAAVKAALESKGQSLVRATKNFTSDLIHEGGMPSQVDKSAFKVGENLATMKGKVVFRNEVFELIQYAPTTEKVYRRPLLMIPPQINRYYVFDLSPEKSIVKYLVEQGQQVFIISWRNPQKKHSHWGLETYVNAAEEAIDITCEITRSKSCNIHGACSGGITLVVLAAYMAASEKHKKINSLTLFVSVFETGTKSLLGMFATDETIEAARKSSKLKGVLDGKDMAKVFAWLRPNDLVWNYWVNNYLLGKSPPAFDVLYWNADTTRLPAQYHSDILDMFKDNVFAEPGKVKINDTPIDLRNVNCDLYVMAGTTDHITPWEACYQSTKLMSSKCDFVLSSSGHIQSILNPPGNPKAKYYLNDKTANGHQEWFDNATEQKGSWWVHWAKWLASHSGQKKNSPIKLGNTNYTPIIDAPGSYIFED